MIPRAPARGILGQVSNALRDSLCVRLTGRDDEGRRDQGNVAEGAHARDELLRRVLHRRLLFRKLVFGHLDWLVVASLCEDELVSEVKGGGEGRGSMM